METDPGPEASPNSSNPNFHCKMQGARVMRRLSARFVPVT